MNFASSPRRSYGIYAVAFLSAIVVSGFIFQYLHSKPDFHLVVDHPKYALNAPTSGNAQTQRISDQKRSVSERLEVIEKLDTVSQIGDSSEFERVMLDRKEDVVIRTRVAEMLARRATNRFYELMNAILNNQAEGIEMQAVAVDMLGGALLNSSEPDKRLIRIPLVGALDNQYSQVRANALEYLCRIGDLAADMKVKEVLRNWDSVDVVDLASAVKGAYILDSRRNIPSIRGLLNHPDENVQIAAIYALGSWGDQESKEAISVLQNAPSANLQRTAKGALKNYGKADQSRKLREDKKG